MNLYNLTIIFFLIQRILITSMCNFVKKYLPYTVEIACKLWVFDGILTQKFSHIREFCKNILKKCIIMALIID